MEHLHRCLGPAFLSHNITLSAVQHNICSLLLLLPAGPLVHTTLDPLTLFTTSKLSITPAWHSSLTHWTQHSITRCVTLSDSTKPTNNTHSVPYSLTASTSLVASVVPAAEMAWGRIKPPSNRHSPYFTLHNSHAGPTGLMGLGESIL